MGAPGRQAVVASGIVLVVVACTARADPTPIVAPVARAEAARNDIRLSAVVESATVAAGEVIEVTATLERIAPDPQELTGSGGGLVFFSVTRLEDGLGSGPPGSTLDCRSYVLSPDEPMTVPFAKSGGFSPDDPNAEFMEAYFADPQLTLPSGTWRIDVSAIGNLGRECGGDVLFDIAVELVVFVEPLGR